MLLFVVTSSWSGTPEISSVPSPAADECAVNVPSQTAPDVTKDSKKQVSTADSATAKASTCALCLGITELLGTTMIAKHVAEQLQKEYAIEMRPK